MVTRFRSSLRPRVAAAACAAKPAPALAEPKPAFQSILRPHARVKKRSGRVRPQGFTVT
jgi:hypothetical protein